MTTGRCEFVNAATDNPLARGPTRRSIYVLDLALGIDEENEIDARGGEGMPFVIERLRLQEDGRAADDLLPPLNGGYLTVVLPATQRAGKRIGVVLEGGQMRSDRTVLSVISLEYLVEGFTLQRVD